MVFDEIIFLSLFIIGLLGTQSKHISKTSRYYVLIMAQLLMLLSCLGWGIFQISGHGIDESVIYHLRYGMEKSGYRAFEAVYISSGLAFILGSLFITYIILKAPFARWLGSTRLITMPYWFTRLNWFLAFVSHPLLVESFLLTLPKKADIPAIRYYAHLRDIPKVNKKMPNLVWIYGESLEKTYLDESLFPGLMPEIKKLSQESLSFGNIAQVFGTGWTIAGMVASQCGIPLVTTGGHGNSMGFIRDFLPGATCLGDILRKQGYHLSYLGGAFSQFAGKGAFYKSHGFQDVLGFEELRPFVNDETDFNEWGIQDDALFEIVRKKLQELYSAQQPFGLFTLNLGTHHPHGYIAKSCQGQNYGDGSNPFLNAVHCTDRLIGKLVNDIRAMDPDNSTLVVIASDHLAMPNTVYEQLEKKKRTNLLILNWPGHLKPRNIDRIAATLSTGVTALQVMGFPVEKLAFGRSLLSDDKTLMEELPNFNDLLASWERDLRRQIGRASCRERVLCVV